MGLSIGKSRGGQGEKTPVFDPHNLVATQLGVLVMGGDASRILNDKPAHKDVLGTLASLVGTFLRRKLK